ncbi:hypothetical protein ACJRO7_017846 [Eucalyptus globulus]|uniref:Toprim domain-containing protein n=1 Tax=Eucalyptus globulus TaxID=34317 RepID=A0ABD3KVZ8_EUCGL
MPFGVAHRLSSCPGLLVSIKPHGSFSLSTALRRSVRCPRTDSKPPGTFSCLGLSQICVVYEGCKCLLEPRVLALTGFFSFHIVQSGQIGVLLLFRMECGWADQAFADMKASSTVQMTEETLRLEPLSDKIIGYFAERKISEETLERDGVKQLSGKESAISFPYKREGQLVGCKYWTLDKKFWQEKGTKKTLYGLDDISEADEIVIVEGEIDKLSLEEAGFRNCASVPSGAPGKVSKKGLPSPDKPIAFMVNKDFTDGKIFASDGFCLWSGWGRLVLVLGGMILYEYIEHLRPIGPLNFDHSTWNLINRGRHTFTKGIALILIP